MSMNGALGWCCGKGACCESWGFSDRDHSPRCCVCPMNSAEHPGITMRAEQFWKSINCWSSPYSLPHREITARQSRFVSLSLFFLMSISFNALCLFGYCFKSKTQSYKNHKIRSKTVHTVNTNSSSFNLHALRILSIRFQLNTALINVTSNPRTHSINAKIARRAWKQVRTGEKGGFCKSPIKVV